ncbi:hypothetical protein ACOMHN_015139 [Nucella lapillus]
MTSAMVSRGLILVLLLFWTLDHYHVTAWPPHRLPMTRRQGCGMFPCAYTHLAKLVGRFAMLRSVMRMLSECANRHDCSPGKRRKRSLHRLLNSLKQRSELS